MIETKNKRRLNHQDTKGTKYNEEHLLFKSLPKIFSGFLGALGVLVVKGALL
jgi:hypothetical protein